MHDESNRETAGSNRLYNKLFTLSVVYIIYLVLIVLEHANSFTVFNLVKLIEGVMFVCSATD